MNRLPILLVGAALTAGALALPSEVQALTMKECSVKYQAARKAGTLKGQTWNDFRKAECADEDATDDEAGAAVKDEPAATPPRPAAAGRPGRIIYPANVASKYANETAGKARLKTCADQYNANKARGANGELRWIQSGGGYWSECNKKLKG